jgi:hypothetical protein
MVLIDANKEKAEGEALDISHGLPFAKPMKIYAGEYKDISDAYVLERSRDASLFCYVAISWKMKG